MLLAIALAGTLATSTPAPPAPMDLARAVAFALDHNAQVLTAKSQLAQAGATLARGRAAQLPLVQGFAQNTMDRQSLNSSGSLAQLGVPVKPQPSFSQNTAQVQGSQSVFDLENSLTANQDRRAYDEAAENLRLAKEQTVLDVETAFYAYAQDVALVALAQSDLAYQQTLYAIADANYRTGRVAGIDRLKAQVQRTSSQENLSTAAADAEDARQNLAQLIGAGGDQAFSIPAAIPIPSTASTDEKTLDAIALARRPEVSIARDALSMAVLSGGLVDAPNRPTVAVQGSVGNQSIPTQFAQNLLPAPFGCGAAHCSSTHFYSVGITSQLLLPLLDWGTLHAARASARVEVGTQSAALDAAQRQAIIDVDQAVRRLDVDRQNVTLATQNAQVARQAAQIAQVQYKVGLGSQIDVTAAEQTYLQAARQLLSAQVGLALAADKLRLATGTLVDR